MLVGNTRMAMKLDDDIHTLSTGRTFYANRGIVGMSPDFAQGVDGYAGVFAEGYDGEEWTRRGYSDDPTREWTMAERQELADHACALWQQWAKHQPAPQPTDEDLAAESAQRLAKANRALQSAK